MAITWNSADKGPNIVLSNGDLTASLSTNGHNGVRATVYKSSGKWYWEGYPDYLSTQFVGIGTSAASLTHNLGYDVHGYSYCRSGNKYHSNSHTSYGDSFGTGDVIGVALDLDNGKIWFSKNEVWQAGGDPVAGTNPAYENISGEFFPTLSLYNSSDTHTGRFIAENQTYSSPTGFVSLEYVPPSYYFSGYVFEQSNPVSRKIYLHNRTTGDLVTTTTASGNGYYYMETASSGSHYIVCLDDEAGEEYNDLIIGSAIPTTMSG